MQTAEKQIVDLLTQVLEVVQLLVKERVEVAQAVEVAAPVAKRSKPVSPLGVGIFTMTSKYNPYRAFQWDKELQANVSLGGFPTIEAARQAQQDYLAGRPITGGVRALKKDYAKLTLVKNAA